MFQAVLFRALQEAGTVLHLARSGRLILKVTNPVRDGSVLVDEKGRRTCKVIETIGPVSNPYFSAQPLTERIERVSGEKLFLDESQNFERKGPFRYRPSRDRRDNRKSRRS
jgi:RNA-binding protein